MLSPDQLAALAAAVAEILRPQIQTAIAEAMSPTLDRARAAAYLGVSADYIDLHKRRGNLKPVYVGRRPFYNRTDLDALKTNKKAK